MGDDRCPVCDRPRATDADWPTFDHPHATRGVCYEEWCGACAERAVDWRARALASAKEAERLWEIIAHNAADLHERDTLLKRALDAEARLGEAGDRIVQLVEQRDEALRRDARTLRADGAAQERARVVAFLDAEAERSVGTMNEAHAPFARMLAKDIRNGFHLPENGAKP